MPVSWVSTSVKLPLSGKHLLLLKFLRVGEEVGKLNLPLACINFSITYKCICFQGLLPRGKQPNSLREKHFQVNHALQEVVSTIPNSLYLNSDPGFVRSDGTISHEDMFDYLHLTRKGYKKFAKQIHDVVLKFVKYPDIRS